MSQPTAQIKFRCKNCGKQFSVHTKLGGRDARCPCGAVLKIPMPEPDAIDLTSCELPPIPTPTPTKRRPSRTASIVAVIGIVFITLVLAFAISMSTGSWADAFLFTFAIYFIAFVCIGFAILPGHIAAKRNHSKAEAIKICGYLSALILWPLWPVAIVWAYTEKNPPPKGDSMNCQSCGYNLTGNVSGICPECGKPIG